MWDVGLDGVGGGTAGDSLEGRGWRSVSRSVSVEEPSSSSEGVRGASSQESAISSPAFLDFEGFLDPSVVIWRLEKFLETSLGFVRHWLFQKLEGENT